ncbi:MAG: site-specific DNA-methyltransferase [Clostridia bacterium]|nr:site-specific DNA-methyltransferase [Clostridia bacterium]
MTESPILDLTAADEILAMVGTSDPKRGIPLIAKDSLVQRRIAAAVAGLRTGHRIVHGDARDLGFLESESVHLVVTSPPYWDLKNYPDCDGQLGNVDDYLAFLSGLEQVWRECCRVLVKGGRLVIVVGDVCRSRRRHGRHYVVPLHASIQTQCMDIGFDNLAPILWYKIANANYEIENGSSFLGKPYEPNAVIKNDVEYILMQRKPGAYRTPSLQARILSVIGNEEYQTWFRQIWSDVPGASTRKHPAPYPEELAYRLIRMFSFVGDTVLDPFAGTGTTCVAASRAGRHSIGVELEHDFVKMAVRRCAQAGLHLVDTPDGISHQQTMFGDEAPNEGDHQCKLATNS